MTETKGLTSAALVGCTGLLGSQILSALMALSPPRSIHTISRSKPVTDSPHVRSITSTETSEWPSLLKSLQPVPTAFISAMGTSKAKAGSLEAQRAIDYDLNLSLARAAKETGTEIYVLISSAAVSKQSHLPYSKMKAELEDAVKELGFPYTVIIKPGLLVGNRTDSRPGEALFRGIAKGLGMVSKKWLTDWWAQDVDIIGKAVVAAAAQCSESKRKPGVWQVDQAEIVRLGSAV